MSTRSQAWALFDDIVATAAARATNPWRIADGTLRFEPDYPTLSRLLGVPVHLQANTQSGVPALALDVWVAYELRRAGFAADRVWPRPVAPRVLPSEVLEFIDALPQREAEPLRRRISVKGTGGASSANILGKNYVKQVDVVMSSWATGPELLVSTKRMDSSFGKNAANRVEESYGDAKNLRLRHPQAALGFVYGLGSRALTNEPAPARWLVDLLGKLGREADAYDAVALVIPDTTGSADDGEESSAAGPLVPGSDDALVADPQETTTSADTFSLPVVALRHDAVPAELDPARFFATMCTLVLDRTPINHHAAARTMRYEARGAALAGTD